METKVIKPLTYCFCKSIKENHNLKINRQSKKTERLPWFLTNTTHPFRLKPWLLELDSCTVEPNLFKHTHKSSWWVCDSALFCIQAQSVGRSKKKKKSI